jgi:hypothetical protein
LDASRVDHLVDGLAGPQHEYKIVLGIALLAVALVFVAAIRGDQMVVSWIGVLGGDIRILHLRTFTMILDAK